MLELVLLRSPAEAIDAKQPHRRFVQNVADRFFARLLGAETLEAWFGEGPPPPEVVDLHRRRAGLPEERVAQPEDGAVTTLEQAIRVPIHESDDDVDNDLDSLA